jgi:hypothetical protein
VKSGSVRREFAQATVSEVRSAMRQKLSNAVKILKGQEARFNAKSLIKAKELEDQPTS